MKKTLLILLTTLLFFACKHELERPTWDVDLLVPLIHSQMSINDILTDSNTTINEDANGFITLIFQEDFIDFKFDTLVNIKARTDEKSTTLDSVVFDDVVIADTSTIGEAISEIPFGTTLFPDGTMRTIPALTIANEDTINVDASEYFETMTLYNGMLKIKLKNGYPTDISNVSLSLINAVNQNLIATFNFPLIPSGTTAEDSIDISGQTLDENLLAILHNMDINASNGDVLINYEDAIITTITIADIGLLEATAFFPEQQLDSSKTEFTFDLGKAQLTEIKIKEGAVTISALSTLPDTGKIIYNIPSLRKNGVPFTSTSVIPPSINGEMTMLNFDFDGYLLDLTGQDGRLGGDTVNTIYSESFTYIDSTGELVTINQTDSFYSFTDFDFVTEYARGFLGQDTLEVEETQSKTNVFNKIISGDLDLESATLSLNIKNYLGADLQIKFDKLGTYNSVTNTTVSAGFNFLSQFFTIPRATEIIGAIPVVPSITNIELDAKDMLEILPNKFQSKMDIYVNPFGQSSTPGFLYPAHTIDASLNLEIPLSLIANNLTLIDTNEVNINQSSEIEIEKLFITIKNGIPFDASINIILYDEFDNLIDTLFNNAILLSAKVDENNMVFESTTSTLTADYNQSMNIRKIITVATFNTMPNNSFVKIYSDYKMDLTMSAKLRKTIGN
ncbi:MAG: hypothetical protein H8E84_04220 [Flavobacteriales bacterium]|nr:hypothetical protein [Flavobacteriales bacterium]